MLPLPSLCFLSVAGPRVQSVKSACAGLSAALGRPVEAARELRGLPVLVDAPGLSPNQLLSDLAFALHASVVSDGRVLQIARTADDRKAVAALRRDHLRGNIEAGLANYDRVLKRSALLGDEAAQVRAANEAIDRVRKEAQAAREAGRSYTVGNDLVFPGAFTPEARLNLALVRRLGAERLADVPPGGARFFSDRPNAAESKLPNCDDLVAEYARRAGLEGAGVPAKVVLRVGETGTILNVFDASGHRTGLNGLNYANRVVIYGSDLPAPGEAGADWRPLDTRSRTMTEFLTGVTIPWEDAEMRSDAAQGSATPLPLPTIPESFLHPEREDPLDFAVRAGVLALPRLPKAPGLVAALSDAMLETAHAFVSDGRIDASAMERALLQPGRYDAAPQERVAREGATVLRPSDPQAAEATHVDRAALGEVMRRVVADRGITLDGWLAAQLDLYPYRKSDVERQYTRQIQEIGLRRPPLLPAPQFSALLGAALEAGSATVDAGRSPLREMIRDGVTEGWLAFQPASGGSDLDASPSTILSSPALDGVVIRLGLSRRIAMDQRAGFKIGFHGAVADGLVTPSTIPPGPDRSEAMIRRMFSARFLQPNYRIGRRIDLTAELRVSGFLPIGFKGEDGFVDRSGVGFTDLPPEFQRAIFAGVRKELSEKGIPIPDPLYEDGPGRR